MSQTNQPTADPFTAFWTQAMSQMAAGQAASAASAAADLPKQMQRAFLDSMAKYFDDFLRSEQYLQWMKQTMDGAVAFRKQMDAFIKQAHESLQTPSREETTDIVESLRQIKTDILDRLEAIEERLDAVEGEPKPKPATKSKPTRGSRPRRTQR